MSNCGNKIKQTCTGNRVYATCTEYETELPEFSTLEDCVTIEETTAELYDVVGKILDNTDLNELGNLCLEYVLDEEGKIIVKNVLSKFEEIICEQQEKIEALQNTSICNTIITGCNFSWGDLTDSCGDQPLTLGETIQLILDKLNE